MDLSAFLDMIGSNEVVVTTKPNSLAYENGDRDAISDTSAVASSHILDVGVSGDGTHVASAAAPGISSSLLEVISELRKRTKSEGDRFLAGSIDDVEAESEKTDADRGGGEDDAFESSNMTKPVGDDAPFDSDTKSRISLIDAYPPCVVPDAANTVELVTTSRPTSPLGTAKINHSLSLHSCPTQTLTHPSSRSTVLTTPSHSTSSYVNSVSLASSVVSSSSSSSPTRLVSPRPMLFVDANGTSKLVCGNCDFKTTNLDAYNRHRCHGIGKRMKTIAAKIAPNSFVSSISQQDKEALAAASAELSVRVCLSCSREFPSLSALKDHKSNGEDVKCKFTLWLRCQTCDFESDQRVEMQEHIFQSHAKIKGATKLMVRFCVVSVRRALLLRNLKLLAHWSFLCHAPHG